jgi:DNA-binding response OmpR family regulator
MNRVLLVEDDESLGRTLRERLVRQSCSVEWVQTAAAALEALRRDGWRLAIVDVRLPDGSGFQLGRHIKRTTSIPLMFMTALNSPENRLEGWELGADEYLPKPFHLKEFVLRVKRLLPPAPEPAPIARGSRTIDFAALSVTAHGRRSFLQARDAKLLELLVEAAPHAVSRSDILDRLWGEDRFPTSRAVDNAIVRLRVALDDPGGRLIQSIRGVGYRWVPAEEEER